jgi:D-arginine dehydrogenase
LDALDRTAEEAGKLVDGIRRLDGAAAWDIVPALKADYVAGAVHEPDAMDIDVDALHQGFLRGVRARGGDVVTDAEVLGLAWTGDAWQVDCRDGTLRAGILVNAAGAWCDQVAALAGAAPVGLVPKRRTAIETWPLCVDVDEQFYFKPDAGRLIGSPADETSMPPCDVQPEELDVAIAVERIETATTMKIAHIARRWAGLRSFVADKTPVVGFDPALPSFFWLAGQGGYDIQTAPSMGQMTAALATEQGVPAHLADLAVTMDALTPGRFSGA